MSESDLHIERDNLDGWSLPAWTYDDPEFAALEVQRIFRPSWQVVCHVSDVPNIGDWHSLDYIGESVIVVRGADQVLRAFTNVCRHRGSRLVDGSGGCAKKLVCPYHAWTYDLDGRLTGVPDSASYPRSTRKALVRSTRNLARLFSSVSKAAAPLSRK
jgi:phenylpropionate dioxygenase-like ring-hydroxylating dioxygenase large terminal subunit